MKTHTFSILKFRDGTLFKLLAATTASHMGLVHVLTALLLIELSAKMPGTVVEDGQDTDTLLFK